MHANASTSGQWQPLMGALAPGYRVLAADLYGAGKTPAWPAHRPLALHDEVALLEPVFERAAERCALVAHSYGAAVGLTAALRAPQRFSALAIYEPTLFSLLDAEAPAPNAADGIRAAVAGAVAALAAGDRQLAAERFIDYWMGSGTLRAMPERRREAVAGSMLQVRHWADALFGDRTPLAAFAELKLPVLFMLGKRSPASARGVARLLLETLPNVQVAEFDALGHMGPVTHPDVVNAVIARFLQSASN